MKIAFILPSLAKKGPIVYTKYLIQSLRGRVDCIKVFYFNEIIEVDMEVECERISFFKFNKFKEYDIVHTHCAKPDLYALINPFINNDKWITTFHDMYSKQLALTHSFLKANLLSRIYSLAVNNVKNAVVFNSAMKDYYIKKAGSKNYKIISTGVPRVTPKKINNEEDLFFLEKLKKQYTLIGSSGLLIKRKGYTQLIEFLTRNKDYACVIIGDGEERNYLEQYAKKKGVENRFVLLGFKDNVIDYYQYFDVFALTSYAEGLPLSLLEALSINLPVVCSNLSNYQDYFTNNDVCLFELDDIESLEQAIIRASNQIEYFSVKSKELYSRSFSLNSMADAYLSFYEEMLHM